MGRPSGPPAEEGVQLKYEEKSSVMSKDTRRAGHLNQNYSYFDSIPNGCLLLYWFLKGLPLD